MFLSGNALAIINAKLTANLLDDEKNRVRRTGTGAEAGEGEARRGTLRGAGERRRGRRRDLGGARPGARDRDRRRQTEEELQEGRERLGALGGQRRPFLDVGRDPRLQSRPTHRQR